MTSIHASSSSRQTPEPAPGGAAAVQAGRQRTTPRQHRATAALVGFEVLTLAIVSALHLSHTLGGGSKPFNPTAAGLAEALIGIVLACGAFALLRDSTGGRRVALAATAFAIVGFLVGLTFTVQGGDAIDVAYHAVMLPLLLVTAIAVLRRPRRARPAR